MVTIGSDLLFQKFMASDYIASQEVINAAPVQLTEVNSPEPTLPENQGFLEKMKEGANGLWSKTKAVVDVKTHYIELKQKAEQWAEHLIKLIVIFLLQTLVIPLLLMWALYAVARGTFELPVKMINPAEN